MINQIAGLISRIPVSLWTVLWMALGGYLYLRFLGPKEHRSLLLDELGTFVILDIIVTRLSLLVLYPSSLLHLSVWTFLSEPPSSGWILGAFVAAMYTGYSLRRKHQATRAVLRSILTALVFGGIVYFLYMWWISYPPFKVQAEIRFVLSILVALWLWQRRNGPFRYPERLFGVSGALLFATSAMVPHFDRWAMFGVSQWVFLAMVLVSILFEAAHDWGNKRA